MLHSILDFFFWNCSWTYFLFLLFLLFGAWLWCIDANQIIGLWCLLSCIYLLSSLPLGQEQVLNGKGKKHAMCGKDDWNLQEAQACLFLNCHLSDTTLYFYVFLSKMLLSFVGWNLKCVLIEFAYLTAARIEHFTYWTGFIATLLRTTMSNG